MDIFSDQAHTRVNPMVRVQLMFQTEPLGTVLAQVGFFSFEVSLMGLWFTPDHIPSPLRSCPDR